MMTLTFKNGFTHQRRVITIKQSGNNIIINDMFCSINDTYTVNNSNKDNFLNNFYDQQQTKSVLRLIMLIEKGIKN
tara:strand:- start:16316 stop:16543 length:228 start_codon:yes stop_codon:yes gene_type:complete